MFLIALFAAAIPAQTQDKEYKISPRDKAELQRLAKKFVARMQQTRDVRPLIPEFYLKDFDLLLEKEIPGLLSKRHGSKLSRREYVDLWIAVVNGNYISNVAYMMDDSGDLKNILPGQVVKSFYDAAEYLDNNHDPTSPRYFANLNRLEGSVRKGTAILKRKNYETSPTYKKELDKRLKGSGGYDYVVDSLLFWNPADTYDKDAPPTMKKRFPQGLRVFTVTTPIGLCPYFAQDHGRFRILLVWLYPWTDGPIMSGN